MLRGVDAWSGRQAFASFPGAMELLEGVRSTTGVILEQVPYAIRNALFFFFLLFLMRVLIRSQWLAALAFGGLFAALSAIEGDAPAVDALVAFCYFATAAVAVLQWGLVSYAVGVFTSQMLTAVPATLDTSAWYFGNMLLVLAIAAAIPAWGLHTSLAGRPRP